MLTFIDRFLNGITMYRVVLYYVVALILAAMVLGYFGFIPYSPLMILYATVVITVVSMVSNWMFAKAFRAQTNVESLYITALILVLIITPPKSWFDMQFLEIGFWASVWAMASKYILAIKRKHIFNPVAFGVALTSFTLGASASWWVATMPMVPFVLIGGLLLTRKILRFDLVLSFLIVALISIGGAHLSSLGIFSSTIWRAIIDTPLFFFAFVMLTEPLTTPPTRILRILYGALTGLFFAPWFHIGSMYFAPEMALLGGNLFSYLVSPKAKLFLTLTEKIQVATDVYDFRFRSDRPMKFRPGQYLEWTLGHDHPDSRGNRRYLTIATSPTEQEIGIGVKFYDKSSTFKKKLLAMEPGDAIIASQLAGDFVLPNDAKKKLVFVAGGIGITPFRSMIKYLIDKNESRSIVVLYANKKPGDIAYKEVFDEAEQKLGIKTFYALSDVASVPANWDGYTGYITEEMILRDVPDYADRIFYVSGPHSMILAFEETLRRMGIPKSQIITDFFPGFA